LNTTKKFGLNIFLNITAFLGIVGSTFYKMACKPTTSEGMNIHSQVSSCEMSASGSGPVFCQS